MLMTTIVACWRCCEEGLAIDLQILSRFRVRNCSSVTFVIHVSAAVDESIGRLLTL